MPDGPYLDITRTKLHNTARRDGVTAHPCIVGANCIRMSSYKKMSTGTRAQLVNRGA